MNILVTGGVGFIGSHFCDVAAEFGNRIVILDSMTYAAHMRNVLHLFKRDERGKKIRDCHFVYGTIGDSAAVEKLIQEYEIDTAVNFAAESMVDRAIKDPSIFLDSNLLQFARLLETCSKNDIDLLQMSTDEVLGVSDEPLDTDAPLKPRNAYAVAKAAAEMMCHAYMNTYGYPVMIVRSCNVYGPRQHPEKLIPKSILTSYADEEIPIYGQGLQERQWLHVGDCAKGVYLALLNGILGETYHLGTEVVLSNVSVVEKIIKNCKGGKIKYVRDRLGHDRRYELNFRSAIDFLGWKPEIGFKRGLRETCKWYRENYEDGQRKKLGEIES